MTHPVSGPVDGNFTNRRRQWLRQAGMAVGAAVMAPGIARAATGPAEPPSTVTQPPRTSTWRVRILVTATPSSRAVRAVPIYMLKVYPNPCNPSTTVSLRTGGATTVRLAVFDATGRVVTQFERQVSGYKIQSIT